jgi:hypothetical protein
MVASSGEFGNRGKKKAAPASLKAMLFRARGKLAALLGRAPDGVKR